VKPELPDTECIDTPKCLTALSGLGACPPNTIPAKLLFQGGQEVLIGHGSDIYRLRITKNGKLILTK
jgi:hypothetical protein